MTVRLKIALTIFLTGLLTAAGVVTTVLFAFERFEHESTYYRATAFLERVVAEHTDMLGMQERHPDEFNVFLRNLVLFEPDSQLYVLTTDGTVLASSVLQPLPQGFKVNLAPVKEASGAEPMPYVMGDDPERMGTKTIVSARALQRAVIANPGSAAGYLYLVCHKTTLSQSSVAALQGTFVTPALVAVVVVVAFSTLLAAWVAASITRPLTQLSAAVADVTRDGLGEHATARAMAVDAPLGLTNLSSVDEFGQLARGVRTMLDTLRAQWDTLRRLDHFRREGVSNLSHDLRSPLTATATCLETLDTRWSGDTAREQDRQLLEVALRNTRNAARLVQSLGDLAQLDEPAFQLRIELMDVCELIDDVVLRFAERAERQGIQLVSGVTVSQVDSTSAPQPAVWVKVDVQLLERAMANLVDNALKFCGPGAVVRLGAHQRGALAHITVEDSGPGIASADLPHLFDRLYQARQSAAPATGEGGKGLGLAIVKRIAELHGGEVTVTSQLGLGTVVTLSLAAEG